MKPQSKRFVVEVKRGTNRSAFLSPDVPTDKFTSAEMALFGASHRPSGEPQSADPLRPQGRVLPSLIEPPPPSIEVVEPARRGRKPGSKNKPKPSALAPLAPANLISLDALSEDARAFAGRPAERRASMPAEPLVEALVPQTMTIGPHAAPSPAEGRVRLRDRSSIIRRYVLGTEPRPGQAGFRKARRSVERERRLEASTHDERTAGV